METLTKENFWDEMEQKYPKAMAHFKAWIDRYKIEHDWDDLFNAGDGDGDMGIPFGAPKYHELPIAMQFGIFNEWSWQEIKVLCFPTAARFQPESFRDVVIQGIDWRLASKEIELCQ